MTMKIYMLEGAVDLLFIDQTNNNKKFDLQIESKYDENDLGLFGRLIEASSVEEMQILPAPGLPNQMHYLL